jgi:hypothetical protein
MAVVVLTKDEMIERILTEEKGFDKNFISIRTKTLPHLKKTGRVTGKTLEEKIGVKPENVVKFGTYNLGAGYNYGDLVRNQLIKEGKSIEEYKEGTSWHTTYKGSNVLRINKKDNPNAPEQVYFKVELITNKPTLEVEYVDWSTGNTINADDLEEFLDVKSSPKNQGTEKPILINVYKMESLYSVSAGGNEYRIRG